MNKSCSRCKETKSYEDFAVDVRAISGLQSACRKCCNFQKKERRERMAKEDPERYILWKKTQNKKATETAKLKNKNRLWYLRKRSALQKIRFPEKYKARKAVQRATASGKLKKKPCEVCGEIRAFAHHGNGYDKKNWLNVEWLCYLHHNIRHNKTIKI